MRESPLGHNWVLAVRVPSWPCGNQSVFQLSVPWFPHLRNEDAETPARHEEERGDTYVQGPQGLQGWQACSFINRSHFLLPNTRTLRSRGPCPGAQGPGQCRPDADCRLRGQASFTPSLAPPGWGGVGSGSTGHRGGLGAGGGVRAGSRELVNTRLLGTCTAAAQVLATSPAAWDLSHPPDSYSRAWG